MDDDTMALLLLAILRDGKPRTADEIAATVARVIRAVEAPEDDAQSPRGLPHGGVGTDASPGRGPGAPGALPRRAAPLG